MNVRQKKCDTSPRGGRQEGVGSAPSMLDKEFSPYRVICEEKTLCLAQK